MPDTPTPSPTTAKPKKGGFFKKPAWLEQHVKSEVKAEKKNPADMFSRSSDSYSDIAAERKQKEQLRAEKKAKAEREDVKSDSPAFKRRRVSTEDEDQDYNAEGATALTPTRRSFSNRHSSSPRSPLKRKGAAMSASIKPAKKETIVIDLGESDGDDTSSTAMSKEDKTEWSYRKLAEEKDQVTAVDDPEEEFPELVAEARERARQRELERQRQDSGVSDKIGSFSESPAPNSEGPNPIIQILVYSTIPNTTPLLVKRRWNQRLREVRSAWCERAGFTPEFAESVFFTWRGRRVFDVASCKSLGVELDAEGNPILGSNAEGFDDGDKIVLVATTQAQIDAEKKLATEEQRRKDEEAEGITAAIPEEPKEKQIRIILKAKGYDPHKLIVKEHKISPEKQISLMFDGETLEPNDVMKDSEIEDRDNIEVHIK